MRTAGCAKNMLAVGAGQRALGAGPQRRHSGGRDGDRGAGWIGAGQPDLDLRRYAGQLIAAGMQARWPWPLSRQRPDAPGRSLCYTALSRQILLRAARTGRAAGLLLKLRIGAASPPRCRTGRRVAATNACLEKVVKVCYIYG